MEKYKKSSDRNEKTKEKADCNCQDDCTCGCHDNEQNENCNCHCGCQEGEECTCGDDCHCQDDCGCDENCDCGCQEGKDCTCDCHSEKHSHKHKHHNKECHCHSENSQENENQYLILAQRLQADFDNYRKRVSEQLDFQREEGKKSVIEVFLPCLDTFKEAKKSIEDEKVLAGINMIEEKIYDALKKLNVEKIDAIGKKFDHNTMEVIAVVKDVGKEEDIILDEFQAGFTFNGKVIRYSKVIVNKLN